MTGWQRIEYPLLQFVTMLIYLRFCLANMVPSVYRQRKSVAKGENLQFFGPESRADAPQVETMRAPSVTAKQRSIAGGFSRRSTGEAVLPYALPS
jgi:hypothetical protein